MKPELGVPTSTESASFLELFDRYTRRTAEIHQLPILLSAQELVNKIDLSDLSADEQSTFYTWLDRRPYMLMSIDTLLLRGLRVKVLLTESKIADQVNYSIQTKNV